MAHRSFHRGLGETSLELKCLFFFGIALALVVGVSFYLYSQVTEHVVYQQNPTTGRLLVDQVMFVKHSLVLQGREDSQNFADFKPVLEKLTEALASHEFQWQFILPEERLKREKLPPDVGPASDAFEIDLLRKYFALADARRSDLEMPPAERLVGPDWQPEEEPSAETDLQDAIPREAPTLPEIAELDPDRATIVEQHDERFTADGTQYQYYQPVWFQDQESCVQCHNTIEGGVVNLLSGFPTPPLEPGDLAAVVRVTIPNGPNQEAMAETRNLLLAVSIITAFLAMIAFYLTIRYAIIRPLRHLRSVSDAISHGNISLRASIHTGDAFEALATAFNRMLGHLVTVQEELRQVNADLDAKVDELAQVNMQLYEMNRIKSDFLATISHELRTPLNSILGFSDVLGSIDSLEDKQKRYVENIRKSGRMLLDMINNILDLAKIESGKTEVRLTDFRLEHVIGAQCDMARPLTERKNIDLEIELQDDLPAIHQDQARVQQILNNLLSNAIKFTPEGGRIRVSASQNDRAEILISVADTGVGIAQEDQQAIFEKFRQGRTAMPGGDAMTREYSGTGLGLSIVRELCRLLGGEVSVQSELGTGSTFTVRLPRELQQQPRLDSNWDAGMDRFTKPRLDVQQLPDSSSRDALSLPKE